MTCILPRALMSLNNLMLIVLRAVSFSFLSITVPIGIPSGKIVDFPPVIIVSPILYFACLGISFSCTIC